ncbi:hypothetical protein A8C32_06215 [Flavivirga aquatica]|uniref:DinB-like domain-containing protein n=1 Tax=Flavivirga aquatica TaxID=1849968 RepID=A0A1E5SI47_9FLAO|nr:DinB family protein [Flavivirga aquatica]OEJ98788.1 hypothetical protein A8C32_06215 [Flavivirga aquatica]
MNIIIKSTLKTLQKSQSLLNNITDDQLCNATVPPYCSSIGSHIRHILDFYECIFNMNSENQVDLTARSRNTDVESKCGCANEYLSSIIERLNSLDFDMNKPISVIDDLGLGKVEIPYTYGALLAQANSHTIHHYAIINYIFERLGILLNDSDFGYNPTTPKQKAPLN